MIKNIFISFYRYKKACSNINPKKINKNKIGVSLCIKFGYVLHKTSKNHVKLKSKGYRIHHQHFNNLTSYLLISFTDAEPIF